jgi:hypothetical protein
VRDAAGAEPPSDWKGAASSRRSSAVQESQEKREASRVDAAARSPTRAKATKVVFRVSVARRSR